MEKFAFLIITTLTLVDMTFATDYCQRKLCPSGGPHIGCKNTGGWGPTCIGKPIIEPMGSIMQAFILDKHNIARNKIALGKVPGYLPADRMPIMTWDKELEKIAKFNVKTCVYGHNPCSNTDDYRYVGQNIAMRVYSKNYVREASNVTISYFIDAWFNEYKNCSMSYINKYRENTNLKIGHFTQIVSMRSKKIGCAASTFRSDSGNRKNFYLVCNYSFANMLTQPIYTSGRSASKCQSGRSRIYKGLCNANENIAPVAFNY